MNSKCFFLAAFLGFAGGPVSALTLGCALISDPVEAERMGSVDRFVINENAHEVHMYSRYSPGEPEWSFGTKKGDVFDPKGDSFLVRKDATGVFGAGVRAGFPHAFYFNTGTSILTWTYIWKDKVTRMQWFCIP
ncbi:MULTISPECIES: hypothetical protein [Microvirga]|uniref:hypothetical protein n=1 Tax=Microvirga TaxID=186650 RepID=UPI0021CA5DA7|nr:MULTISPECIES: hypothetical protein [unclassified Microvirga]